MLLSVEWLGRYVDLGDLDAEQVAHLYTMRVAEVSGVEEPGGGWPGIVVSDVTAVRPHPNADKLRLVTVDPGSGPIEVVCGAPNVAVGQRICFAPEGTELSDGTLLTRRKIRGVASGGMVLSERELGLSDEHEGILVLDTAAAAGTPVREVLGGGAVLDVDNTAITTRPDLWGHYGAARELAAVLERDLKPLDLGDPLPGAEPEIGVRIDCPDLCPRYLGWVIRGVEVGPSPDWLKRSLEQAGQRSINNVVDLTNYILLECGQPLHAFDRRQIAGGAIVVRRSRAGERVVTLDGLERELPEGCCMIADGERAVAIAGVMGLENSEVREETTEIILEVANFEMASVRTTAQALDLRTESAIRFEKGLDPEGVPMAARRFYRLLQECCPGAEAVGGPRDVYPEPAPARTIETSEDFIPRTLGLALEPERVDAILSRLGFRVERSGGRMRVQVPSWRAGRDVSLPADLVEEVGRIHGYDKIDPIPLTGALEPVPDEPERAARSLARRVLSHELGLSEVHAYPFCTAEACRRAGVEPGRLRLANAEQPGLDLMVTSQVPGLLEIVSGNLRHHDVVALYQTGRVFEEQEGGTLPEENERLTIALAARGGGSPALEVKGVAEALARAFGVKGARLRQEEGPAWLHPGRCGRLERGGTLFGWLGEVHPRVARAFDIEAPLALADLDLDALRGALGRPPRMRPISRYPVVPFDVAVLVDRRCPAGEVEAVLRKSDSNLVREVRLFDDFEGEPLPAGKRSLAFTVVFGSLERTLDTVEVERLRTAVKAAVAKRGWKLRI